MTKKFLFTLLLPITCFANSISVVPPDYNSPIYDGPAINIQNGDQQIMVNPNNIQIQGNGAFGAPIMPAVPFSNGEPSYYERNNGYSDKPGAGADVGAGYGAGNPNYRYREE